MVNIAESNERRLLEGMVGSSIPSGVKSVTSKIGTWRFLARHSPLLGQDKDGCAQCQDIVTEWDIRL